MVNKSKKLTSSSIKEFKSLNLNQFDHFCKILPQYFPIILIFIILIIYFQVYSFKFVYWDDHVHLFLNPLLSPFNFKSFWTFWTESYEGFYVPVTYSIWGLIEFFFGLDPLVFHCFNVILHILNCFLFFRILKRILSLERKEYSDLSAALGAILFAVHPIQVESVAWATGMKDLLCTFFSFLTIDYYLKGKNSYLILFFAFAMLSKPSAITIPAILLLIETLLLRKPIQQIGRTLWKMFLAVPIFTILMIFLQPAKKLDFAQPLWIRPWVILDTLNFYLFKWVLPFNLTPIYGRTPQFLIQSKEYLWTIWPVSFIFVGLFWLKRNWLTAGFLIFCIGVGPVSGVIPFFHQNHSTVCDRYLYFPSIGLFLILAYGFNQKFWKASIYSKQVRLAASFALILLLSWMSFLQVKIWEDDDTLFPYVEKLTPQVAIIHGNYGMSLIQRNQVSEALKHFYRATELSPDPDYYNDLGITLARVGKIEEAKEAYRKGLVLNPDHQAIIANLKLIEHGH